MSVDVLNECGYAVDELELVACARHVMDRMKVHPDADLAISLVDEAAMTVLHEKWMDLPGPTDVMSFPMDELTPGGRPDLPDPGPAMLGDIVLCPAFAADQAASSGHPLAHELALLTVHGCLHLLGYDHVEPAEEREMFGLQNELLGEWYDHRADAPREDA